MVEGSGQGDRTLGGGSRATTSCNVVPPRASDPAPPNSCPSAEPPATVLRLRPFAESDVDELRSWVRSPAELVTWAGASLGWPLDRDHLVALARSSCTPTGRIWSAVDGATGVVVGHVELARIDLTHRSARLSRVLVSPTARGTGIGTAMVDAALRVAFDELGLHRVALSVYVHNAAALHLYEGLGFEREGLSRDVALVEGRWWDAHDMAVLNHEWRRAGGSGAGDRDVSTPAAVTVQEAVAGDDELRVPSPDSERSGVVAELDVADLDRSIAFYVGVLGFSVRYERPEERFVYLVRGRAELMLEEAAGPGRRFRTAPIEHPYGRGMNLQVAVADVDDLHRRVLAAGVEPLVALEERWYRVGGHDAGLRQFVVADPDGYLLRFAEPVAE